MVREATMNDIIKATGMAYGRTMAYMKQDSQRRVVVRPRQIAQYMCRKYTPRILREIGAATGGRDHATVYHSFKKVEFEYGRYPDVTMLVDNTIKEIANMGLSLKEYDPEEKYLYRR